MRQILPLQTVGKVSSERASPVSQWLRIYLPVQETWVRALVWEDSMCLWGATKPLLHNYWSPSALELMNHSSVQFSSVAQSCPILCNSVNRSTPGLSVHHQLLEFTQTHIHQVSDAIQPFHPLSPPFSPAPNPSQHQSLFNSSHEVARVLEFQL